MAAPTLSRKTLDDLKRRHIAFLEKRLTSDEAREDWARGLRDGFDRLLTVRIRDVLEPAAMAKGLHRALTADSIRTFFAPVARDLHREVLASLAADRTSLGDYVPPQARRSIDALLARGGLVPDALVRKVFEQKAVQDVVHDTLYEGLTQFNTVVNPFFADWGLPAILRLVPIGGALILASMGAVRAEFDRRLEPEIRKFLAAFSRRATSELTDVLLTRSADPRFVELRTNLVAFLYSQSLEELLAGVGEETVEEAGLAVEHVLLGLLERDRSGENLRRVLDDFVSEQGDATFADWLEDMGATGRPDLDGWAELLWPYVRSALLSPVALDFLARVTAEFYDGLGA